MQRLALPIPMGFVWSSFAREKPLKTVVADYGNSIKDSDAIDRAQVGGGGEQRGVGGHHGGRAAGDGGVHGGRLGGANPLATL